MRYLSEIFSTACCSFLAGIAALTILISDHRSRDHRPSWEIARNASASVSDETFMPKASAFHVGGGVWVTARHVMTAIGKTEVNLTDDYGDVHQAVEVASDLDRDVSLLVSTTFPSSRIPLDCGVHPIGTEVHAVGSPSRVQNVTSFGRISSEPRRNSLSADTYYVAIPGAPGMSGGVVAKDGKAIGVFTGVSVAIVRGDTSIWGMSVVTLSRAICNLILQP